MYALNQNRRVAPVVWLLLVALGLALLMQLGRFRLSIPDLEASIEGTFLPNAPVPNGRAVPHTRPQWSSWVGDDNHRGHLTLGPFVAPSVLGFDLTGYPRMGGNRLYFENRTTGATWDPALDNAGEEWKVVVVELPADWRGAPVVMHVVDNAAEWGGWLALTRPVVVPRWTIWWNGVPRILCTFLLTGVVLLIVVSGAAMLVKRLGFKADSSLLALSCGLAAVAGYLAFWLAFAQAGIGAVAAWGGLAAAAWFGVRCRGRSASVSVWTLRDWRLPAALMFAAGVFYVAALYLYPTDQPMSAVAQLRFQDDLPSDNAIPQYFADRLLRGVSPKMLSGDWLSSDRPPLQAGWLLLLMRPALAAGVDFDTAAQCAGIWFQLLWIPFLWMALRSIGVSLRVAALIVAALAPSGFLFVNSVYVWPKLGGAALVLGAAVLWFVGKNETAPEETRFGAGGMLVALGWLSHGGIAFGLLGLLPGALWQLGHAKARRWMLAGVGFLLFVVPWFAYQKWYEPPGNRLIKWHIAGQIPIDDRGTMETLVDAYRETPFDRLADARQLNLRVVMEGRWRQMLTIDWSKPQERQHAEFFSTFYALGWWNAGFPVLLLTVMVPRLRARLARRPFRPICGAIGWAFATLVVWVLLMFNPGNAVIHQGSYTVLLVLFPALALTLWLLHPAAFAVVAVAQIAAFPFIWFVPKEPDASVAVVPAMMLGLAAIALVAMVVNAWQADEPRPVSVT